MKSLSRGLMAAVVLAALAAAPAYAAPTVSIRIEGEQRTLVERTTVTLSPAQVEGVDDTCPGDTIAGAIEEATNGDWDRSTYTQTIAGETRDFSNNDAWSGWLLNTAKLSGGFCSTKLAEGDDVLILANYADPAEDYRWTYQPLILRDVPAQVERGAPFTVRVEKIVPARDAFGYEQPDTGSLQPAGAVRVTGGGVQGITDDGGRTQLVIDEPGDHLLVADSRAGLDRSLPVPVRAAEPGTPPPPPPAPVACETRGDDGRCGTIDREAPTALITSIREGAVFKRRSAPRELGGTAGILAAEGVVPDGSGILMMKLKLTRRVGPRCSTWSPTKERFVRRPCGAAKGFWFKIGEQADWDYLLPRRLGRGRYVLDADAIDRAGNRLRTRKRGQNRVVFRVRR